MDVPACTARRTWEGDLLCPPEIEGAQDVVFEFVTKIVYLAILEDCDVQIWRTRICCIALG
jgi:hypothetical protein